jgi:predicted phage terminase large subunit-like protein
MDYTWSIVYESAEDENKQPTFPHILSAAKLDQLRKTLGSYKFANQYLNVTIPEDDQDFKKTWLKYYDSIPSVTRTFIFIDPAISLEDEADYTATVVVKVDVNKNWYLVYANRQRITATQTVEWVFKLQEKFKANGIGIEDVAYQKALLHFLSEEMRKRNKMLPIQGVKRSRVAQDGSIRSDNSKPLRIRSLVPRFEWGQILINRGLHDFEMEYSTFPRGSHDDIMDALASIEEIAFYPTPERTQPHEPRPNDPDYEKHFIQSLKKRKE